MTPWFALTLSLASAWAAAPAPDISTAVVPAPPAVSSGAVPSAPALRLLAPEELPVFSDSFPAREPLVKAAKKSLAYLARQEGARYVRIGGRDYGAAILADSIRELLDILALAKSPEQLNALVRDRFDVFQSAGSDGQGKVVFSSYYQPILPASVQRSARYPVPIYRRPPDLVEADLSVFDKKYGSDVLIGRVTKGKRFVPYFSREDIDVRKTLRG